jgi:type IX secretion system PorP/SprF family membrane protein
MKRCLLPTLCGCLLSFGDVSAQDPHFSQFYAAPLTFNPALAGGFSGSYRLGIIYRDQWRQVLDFPNVTYAATADFRFPLQSRKKRQLDAIGAGVIFYSDKFSGLGFSTNQISMSGAYHKALSGRGDQYLSLGGQIDLAQRNVNYNNLTFEDQFNGSDAYIGGTGEFLPENNFTYFDYAVGLNYTLAPSGGAAVYAGLALHHVLEPQVSFFYDRNEDRKRGDSPLMRKLTGHFTLQIPLSTGVSLSPRALFYQQGPHMALNAGTNFRFLLNDRSGTAWHLGGWARPVRNEIGGPFKPESVVFMTGLEISNFMVGFSYDANISDFTAANNRRSAFEISIAFLGNYDSETILCPKF